jgi:hypothetical protein
MQNPDQTLIHQFENGRRCRQSTANPFVTAGYLLRVDRETGRIECLCAQLDLHATRFGVRNSTVVLSHRFRERRHPRLRLAGYVTGRPQHRNSPFRGSPKVRASAATTRIFRCVEAVYII